MTGFTLHLMRHGEPEGAGRLLGHRDPLPLTEGMAACVDRVAALAIDQVISSDLARASQPAHAIARAHSAEHIVDPRWRELDFGDWDGADPATLDPARLSAFWDDPEANPPPNGECWSALVARVGAALDGIVQPALVLTHAGAMRAAMASLLSLTYRQGWSFHLPYAALLTLRVMPGSARCAQITGLAG